MRIALQSWQNVANNWIGIKSNWNKTETSTFVRQIQRELLLSFCAVIYLILPIRLLRFFYITHVRTNDNGCGFVRSNSAHSYFTQYICVSAKYTVSDLTSPSGDVCHSNIIIAQCSSKQPDTYSSCTVWIIQIASRISVLILMIIQQISSRFSS